MAGDRAFDHADDVLGYVGGVCGSRGVPRRTAAPSSRASGSWTTTCARADRCTRGPPLPHRDGREGGLAQRAAGPLQRARPPRPQEGSILGHLDVERTPAARLAAQMLRFGVWNVRTKRGRKRPPAERAVVEDAHPAIITEEARAIAQARRVQSVQSHFDTGHHRSRDSRHLLSGGLFRGARCGSNMTGFRRWPESARSLPRRSKRRGAAENRR